MAEQSDDDLLLKADRSGPWMSQNGIAPNLTTALLRVAELVGQGHSPYPLQGPDDVVVGHAQILRLWKRLGITPANRPT
jgi:hypothetical protein